MTEASTQHSTYQQNTLARLVAAAAAAAAAAEWSLLDDEGAD